MALMLPPYVSSRVELYAAETILTSSSVGGFLGAAKGWKWDFYIGAIITSVPFVVALFLFPETLFSRDEEFLATRTHERSYIEMLFNFKGNMIPNRQLRLSHFTHSFAMLKYPSVTLPFIYYTLAWTFINI